MSPLWEEDQDFRGDNVWEPAEATKKLKELHGMTPNDLLIATRSGYINVDGLLVQMKYAKANIAASQTASSLVAAVTGKKIRVIQLAMVAGATATDATFNSGSSPAISPLFANGANGGAVLPNNKDGWFETVASAALTVTTGAGSTTGFLIGYIEV